MGYASLFGGYKEEEEEVKRWAGLHDYREPCPIFSAAPGGVSGQPGNNGSYAPGTVQDYPCPERKLLL